MKLNAIETIMKTNISSLQRALESLDNLPQTADPAEVMERRLMVIRLARIRSEIKGIGYKSTLRRLIREAAEKINASIIEE